MIVPTEAGVDNKEAEQAMKNGAKIANKALQEADDPKVLKMIQDDPVSGIADFAIMFTMKAREAGVNDLASLAVAGSLIITGLVNVVAESGIGEEVTVPLQAEAMQVFMKAAIKDDRMQNGFTEENTPPDENGQVPAEQGQEVAQPPQGEQPVMGGQQ